MDTAQLRQLKKLSDARKTQALAKLERVMAEDQRLVAEIARIRALPLLDFDISTAGVPLSQIGLRIHWADQSVRRLNQQRASLIPEIDRLRREAAILLGKHEALGTLTDRAERDQAQHRVRRAEAETPFTPPRDPSCDI